MVEAAQEETKEIQPAASEVKVETDAEIEAMFPDCSPEERYLKMPSEHNPITQAEWREINRHLRKQYKEKPKVVEENKEPEKPFNNQNREYTLKNCDETPFAEVEKCLTWGPVTDVKPVDLRFDEEIEKEVSKLFTDKTSPQYKEELKKQKRARDEFENAEVRKKTSKELREINREVTVHMDRWANMLEFERRLWLEVSNTNEHNRRDGLINVNKQLQGD